MDTIEIKKGLDLPIKGAPEQTISDGPKVRSVGLLGPDIVGLKPKMLIEEQASVVRGTPLFHHKDDPDAEIGRAHV